MRDGRRYVGAAVTTKEEVMWAESRATGTSIQRAELISLIKALELGQGQKVNVYTNSQNSFTTAHIHGSVHKERGLLTEEGKNHQ